MWARPHQPECGEEWSFYRDFAVYCLSEGDLTRLVESELPSEIGQLNPLENNLNRVPVEILLSFCG